MTAEPMTEGSAEERRAMMAYILDRADNDVVNREFVLRLLEGIASGHHVACYRAGEYDDLEQRVRRIQRSYMGTIPLPKRPSLRSVP